MNKKWSCLLLALLLLVTILIPVHAEETEEAQEDAAEETVPISEPVFLEIADKEAFLGFAENCRLDSYSQGLVVTLKNDIDLSGTDFSGIPFFSGVFYGEGHTISGLSLTADGSFQGLFRYLTGSALVSDLVLKGTVTPGGSANSVGGIAGRNDGTVKSCTVQISVSGNSMVGGIAGTNGVTGIIEDCAVHGQVDGTHFVGGIAGENQGVVRQCTNNALINTVPSQNEIVLSDITLETITDSEASNSATDIGGICGSSSGIIRKCENLGAVGYPHMGFNVGGIAGTQSGHIADCVNRAEVRGRKEVGGIVGQMEPTAYVEFSVDTIQILKDQLGELSGLVDKAAYNAGGSAGVISGQIGALQDQATTAKEAVETLLNADLTDRDTILAAQNTLTTTLEQMPGTIDRIAGSAQALVGGLSRDMKLVSERIAIMGETLNEASENMGIVYTDISDMDTEELLGGKVLSCVNRGNVLGDLNVGGISGAMSFENDLDVMEDWESMGQESMNIESKIRAVILSCDNLGSVTASKQNVGGIVGLQTMGLVRNAVNTGLVDGTGADYVGGVAGHSMSGYIRGCGAKCEIVGKTCVGGVAGSALVVTDSLAAVRIREATEMVGGILGALQEDYGQEEQSLSGNFYLPLERDLGAVDGISFDGQAQPLELEEFQALAHLPYAFRRVTVRFAFDDGTVREVVLVPGTALAPHRIPQVPTRPGLTGEWEGLEDADLSRVMYDMTFRLYYEGHRTAIESSERIDDRPVVLAEGLFGLDAELVLSQAEDAPPLQEGQILLDQLHPEFAGDAKADVLRFLLTEDLQTERLTLCVRDGSGWRKVDHTVSGSYIVFPWSDECDSFALIQEPADYTLWYIGGGAVLALAIAITMVSVLRSKKKKALAKDQEAE